MGKVTFDKKATLRQIISSGGIDNIAVAVAKDKLEVETLELLKEFKSSDISKEIEDGNGATNTSGTLGGYGNLFSFIGFKAGSNPIGTVVQYLISKIKITKNINYLIISDKKIRVSVLASIPNKQELADISQTEWDGSWLLKMSTGISGLGYYIQKMLRGRSLGGVQSRKKIRTAKFRPKTYFVAMYKKFVVRLSKTNSFK